MVLVMKQDCSGNLLSSGSVRAGVIGQQSKQVLPDNSEVAASGVTQTVRLPRRRSAASYSAQFAILYWAGLWNPMTTRFIGLVRHQGSRDQWATSIRFSRAFDVQVIRERPSVFSSFSSRREHTLA
jgi:hypothetical protein